jgi:predicted dehydrogenase
MLDRKPRVGVFGLNRGSTLAKNGRPAGLEFVAACDKNPGTFKYMKGIAEPDAVYYTDFDDFIRHDMDAVILANYFNQHTEFAIKAMKAGKAVISECTPAASLAECVALVEAAEQTGMKYMLAENYPFMRGCAEMARVYQSGILGKVVFAEGEYVHPMSSGEFLGISPGKNHWRRHNTKIHYITHSLGPLLYMTGAKPVRVNAETVFLKDHALELYDTCEQRAAVEEAGIMLIQMDNGAVFRISGSNNLAPHDNWYRLACTNGSIETVRGNNGRVILDYGAWELPVGVTESHRIYDAQWDELTDLAINADHGGGDFWEMYKFMRYLRYDEKPYFDVYNSVIMSATAVMAYKSALCEGAPFDIPDFRDRDIRKLYAEDRFTPFPDYDTGEGKTLPSNAHQDLFDAALAAREAAKA